MKLVTYRVVQLKGSCVHQILNGIDTKYSCSSLMLTITIVIQASLRCNSEVGKYNIFCAQKIVEKSHVKLSDVFFQIF